MYYPDAANDLADNWSLWSFDVIIIPSKNQYYQRYTQLSPEILTQGKNWKKHPKFLEANFEYFWVLTAMGDV